MKVCTECAQETIVEKYESLLKSVVTVFESTPREYSEGEWTVTDERADVLEAIRATLGVE
jgi:hypothetical protein